MKSYINILTIVIIAITMFGINQTALAQDGWTKTYSTMASDSIYVHAGGSRGSDYAIRVQTTADQISDSVIYGRKVNKTPFDGIITMDKQSFNTSVVYMVSIALSHGDTTIINGQGGFYLDGISSWRQIEFDQLWSGTLAIFDSITLVVFINPLSPLGTQIADFDNFSNGAGTIFYDGGEKGTVSGVLFYDSNQNGVKDNGEAGIDNWKLYLVGTTTDSTTTNFNGDYVFTAVARGTYTVKAEVKNGWTPTTQDSTIVVGDTLYWQINFGEYAPLAYYMTVNSRWNMVALPNRAYEPSVTALFPTAISNAFSYNGTYTSVDTLKIGVGYWLKFPENAEVIVVGDSIKENTVTLQEGWNMIGGLTEIISVNSIMVEPPTMVTSQFFTYNESYVTTDSIKPGAGYWVKASEAGTLYLSSMPKGLLAKASYSRINIVNTGELPPPAPDGKDNPSTTLRVPNEFHLEQNYPNPFNPVTVIAYAIPNHEARIMNYELVTLKVFNMLGQEVATLVNEAKEPGIYTMKWDARGMPTGMYFYRLYAGNYVGTKKLILLK